MTAEQIEVAWPGLLAGPATHPGVSFAIVNSTEHGPAAIGEHGVIHLSTGEVTGSIRSRHLAVRPESTCCGLPNSTMLLIST